jgi:hypothetical protein
VLVDDFTGDGLADIIVMDGSGPETVLSLRVNIAGQRWSPPYIRSGLPRYSPRAPSNPTIFRTADLNANGSVDLIFRNTSPQDTWAYVELLPTGAPSLMAGIDNSLGKRTTIVYGSASEDEQRARQAEPPEPNGGRRATFCRLEHVVPWAIRGAHWEPLPAEAGGLEDGLSECAWCAAALGEEHVALVRSRGEHRIPDGFCGVAHLLEWAKAGGRWRS